MAAYTVDSMKGEAGGVAEVMLLPSQGTQENETWQSLNAG